MPIMRLPWLSVRFSVLRGDLDTGDLVTGYSTAAITLGYFGVVGTFEL